MWVKIESGQRLEKKKNFRNLGLRLRSRVWRLGLRQIGLSQDSLPISIGVGADLLAWSTNFWLLLQMWMRKFSNLPHLPSFDRIIHEREIWNDLRVWRQDVVTFGSLQDEIQPCPLQTVQNKGRTPRGFCIIPRKCKAKAMSRSRGSWADL